MRFRRDDPHVVDEFKDCADALVNWFESQEIDAKESVAIMGFMISGIIRGREARIDFLETMASAWKLDEKK